MIFTRIALGLDGRGRQPRIKREKVARAETARSVYGLKGRCLREGWKPGGRNPGAAWRIRSSVYESPVLRSFSESNTRPQSSPVIRFGRCSGFCRAHAPSLRPCEVTAYGKAGVGVAEEVRRNRGKFKIAAKAGGRHDGGLHAPDPRCVLSNTGRVFRSGSPIFRRIVPAQMLQIVKSDSSTKFS